MNNLYYLITIPFLAAIIIFFPVKLTAQTLDSPLSFEGGADAHLYKSDTVMIENTILDSGWKTRDADTVATGFYMMYSPYLSVLYLPFFYAPVSWFEADVTLPFMYKLQINSSSEREKTGFGDIKLGLNFCLVPLDKAIINFRVKLTFPTGDACARDRDLIIPMGYGTFTLSGLWSLSSFHFGNKKFGIRFYGNFGVVGYFDARLDPDGTYRHNIDYSYAISTLGGLEMKIINRIYILGKVSYAYLPERRYKTEDTTTGTTTGWTDLNDSLHTLDIIAGLKFDFIPDFSGTVMTVVPIYEEQDSDIARPKERRWKIFLGIEKTFGLAGKGKREESAYKDDSDIAKDKEPVKKTKTTKKKKKKGLLY